MRQNIKYRNDILSNLFTTALHRQEYDKHHVRARVSAHAQMKTVVPPLMHVPDQLPARQGQLPVAGDRISSLLPS
jgi:hypothetical protein